MTVPKPDDGAKNERADSERYEEVRRLAASVVRDEADDEDDGRSESGEGDNRHQNR